MTPVNPKKFQELLEATGYNKEKLDHVINGFKYGFSLGYQGKTKVKLKSPNLKLYVGSEIQLWNKMMKEVKEKCFAGPFDEIPFQYYIQSPIGLVPKDQGRNSRLIFHLSYPRDGSMTSVNINTPKGTVHSKISRF